MKRTTLLTVLMVPALSLAAAGPGRAQTSGSCSSDACSLRLERDWQ
ncbi:MAG: hypothetical protein P8099_04860 [Gemmatimonadota bacterium]|jgi:hypothetical protein